MDRKRIVVLAGMAISLFFLWVAFREQNWGQIVAAFRQADYRWLIPASALILLDYLFRAWRWGAILRPAAGRRLSLNILYPVLMLGFAANNVLPARAGELWRMWGLSRRTKLRKTVAFSTLVVERVCDGFVLLFFLALAGVVQPLTGQAKYVEYMTFFLFAMVLLGLLLILLFEAWTLRAAAWLMQPVPAALRERLLGVIERFASGLHALRRPRALFDIVGSSLLAWGSQAVSFTMILLAFNLVLPPATLFAASVLMLALINLLIMIPAGPGNVGTFETGGILALTIVGLAAGHGGQAAAIVLVTHMLQWLLVTAVGVAIAVREGITLAGLTTEPELHEG